MSDMHAAVVAGTAQLLAMGAAWGIYALLFGISVFLIVKAVNGSLPRKILLFSTCLMFAFSTTWLQSIPPSIWRNFRGLLLACETLFDSLFLMGDTIVIWRTWILCPEKRLLVAFPIVLWFSGLSSMLGVLATAHHTGSISGWQIGLSMATSALSAATNFFCTLLIWKKAWERRTVVDNAGGDRPRKIMFLLVESGFIYLALWVLALLNFYLDWHAPALQAALRGAGIYPTFIIVLVHLNCTFWDNNNCSTSTRTSGAAVFSTIAPSMSITSDATSHLELDFQAPKIRWRARG
ncbi:hypothetical protein R3P38DRAFT_3074685 [Favolaschia claudopus]|uniref:Uncharacterized protein n=1 Tax=Favolaschia claudopus TaxID=2862362 RepID=A0AAV9ZXC1_9AGAR